jgi:hypothetical protein
MFFKWIKELAAETFASIMFIIGAVSNVLTFFFPGLPAPFLRTLGFSLIGLGFVLANLGVYKKLRIRISGLEGEIEEHAKGFSVALSLRGETDQTLKVDAERSITTISLEYLTTDGTCTARDAVEEVGESFEIFLNENSVREIWNFSRVDRNKFDNSGPIKLRLTFSANGKKRNCVLSATIMTKMHAPVIQGSETFHLT